MLSGIFRPRTRQKAGRELPADSCAEFYDSLGEGVRELPSFDDIVEPAEEFDLCKVIDVAITQAVRDTGQPFVCPPREKEERVKNCVHPSSAYGCARRLAFSLLELNKNLTDIDTKMHRIFGNGHLVHQRLQGYLFECLYRGLGEIEAVYEDVMLQIPWLVVFGELDAVVVRRGQPYLVEVKSSNRKGFDQLREPKPEWLWQTYLYMAATGIRTAIVLVECKDSQRMKQFHIEWDWETWDEIHDEILAVIEAVMDGEIPNAPGDAPCFWCDYSHSCEDPEPDWSALDRIHLPVI